MYEINTFLTLLIVKYVCYLVRSETNGMISDDTLTSKFLCSPCISLRLEPLLQEQKEHIIGLDILGPRV